LAITNPALDTFTRADATSLGTASSGREWTTASGSFRILSNQAKVGAGQAGESVALIDSGITSGPFAVTFDLVYGETSDIGFLPRAISKDNYLLVTWANSGAQAVLTMWRKSASSTYASRGSINSTLVNNGATNAIRVEITMEYIAVFENDILAMCIRPTLDIATFAEVFTIGLRANGAAAASAWDNLKIHKL
jgi:hypothetical protein